MTRVTEQSETSNLPNLFPQVHEAMGDLSVDLDSSAYVLMDDSRKIALALGFRYVDPAHIVLAKLVQDYSEEAAKDMQPSLKPVEILKKTSPKTSIIEIDVNKAIPLSRKTIDILVEASSKSVGKTSRGEILTYTGEAEDIFRKSLVGIKSGNLRPVIASRIADVIGFITPKPIFSQKTA